jgi:putative ABC transport system permease protein
MRLSNIIRLYRVRLRTRVVQELFAILGIAVGVALLFASQVANTSLNDSVRQLTSGIVGHARFQLVARNPEGFDQRLLSSVEHLPGVRGAVPVLEEHANVIGPTGSRSVYLFGTDPRFARLGGSLLRHFTAAQLNGQQAFALPAPIAQAIGVSSLQTVELQIGAGVKRAFLGTELLEADVGALVHSPVAIAPLAYAQRLTGMTRRITRILVQAPPEDAREVQAGLRRLAGDRLNVRPADFEAMLFTEAATPTNQSTALFSAISALVGFLFAFNAMLLTLPQRRNLIEDLRLDGYTRWMIIKVLLFDALVLGTMASLVGLALGELLSIEVFRANPGYLSVGFPIGSQRIVSWQSIALAAGGGMLAACIGVLAPLRDVFSRLSRVFMVARGVGRRRRPGALTGGLTCLAATTSVLLLAPRAAIVGIATLMISLLLLLPVLLRAIVFVFDRMQRRITGAAPYLAIVELRSQASRPRSIAIAATGAIAVFGSVAIQGAHANLQEGLDHSSHDLAVVSDVWATPAGAQNVLATAPFHGTMLPALARLPGVQTVRLYRAGFLDFGGRRIWVIGPPREALQPIPPRQLVSGNLALASARFRQGGWAIVSSAIAEEHHLHIGQSFTLPSARPTVLRVAALSTNLGWPPGAIVLNADDYARAWASSDPSAYNVMLAPGVSPERGREEVQRVLGAASGLTVETAGQRERRQRAVSRQGLARLTQISSLVLIAAVLAMATAMGAMIWQRRLRLADMKVDGFSRGVLWRALLLESILLLGAGCSIGAVFGLYGQLLLTHALATVTGFPIVFSLGALVAIASFTLVTAVGVAIVAIPGYLAARVRPAISLQD